MKKSLTIMILVSLFISMTLYSQNIEKLDEKSGFKDFKIGDDISKWKPYLNYQNEKGNEKNYLYNGRCCDKIYDYYIQSLYLSFANNKLTKIHLIHYMKPESGSYLTSVNPNKINSKLIESFGIFTSKDVEKGSNKLFLFWFGKKVDLLSVYEYMGANVGEKFEILVMDKKTVNSHSDDGF